MDNEDWKLLHHLVVTAASDVFRDAGMETKNVGLVPQADAVLADVIAVIGLGGEELRGSLVLSIPNVVLKSSHPAKGESAEDLADWLAELSNLLLGRIKARLITRGVTIALSSPIALPAADLRRIRFATTPVVHKFDFGDESIFVIWEAVAKKDEAKLAERPKPAAIDVGEVAFF